MKLPALGPRYYAVVLEVDTWRGDRRYAGGKLDRRAGVLHLCPHEHVVERRARLCSRRLKVPDEPMAAVVA